MALYQENMADKSLVVGDIQVLGKLGGKSVKKIIKDIEAVKNQTLAFRKEIVDFWSEISDDYFVSPEEKVILKREFQNVKRSYAALLAQALTQNLTGELYFVQYTNVTEELTYYLNNELRLFDDMNNGTDIPDREVFNKHFSDYYYSEKFCQIALATGIMGNLGFRVLENLDEPGNENEIALYRGQIYQYVNGKWETVGLEGYQGTRTTLPKASENQYFLSKDDFAVAIPLYINGKPLLINNANMTLKRKFKKGLIYLFQGNKWIELTDTSDYRYVVALVDYISVTGELPGAFQQAIDNAIKELEEKIYKSLDEEIEERKGQLTIIDGRIVRIDEDIKQNIEDIERIDGTTIKHLPVYFGLQFKDPEDAIEEDYYVWAGTTTATRIKGDIYVLREGEWQHVEPRSGDGASMYQIALDDILSLNLPNSFGALFADAFFAHQATIDVLGTQTIKIRTGGAIQSDIYIANSRGTHLDTDGNLDANGNTHIGGTLKVDGDTTIGGNVKIDGNNVEVTGKINATSLYVGPKKTEFSEYTGDLVDELIVDKNKGAWNGNAYTYYPGDMVTYLGTTYFCTKAHNSSNILRPTDTNYWRVFAEKGAPGDAGDKGTSLRDRGELTESMYYNDDNYIDIVSYQGSKYMCIKNHDEQYEIGNLGYRVYKPGVENREYWQPIAGEVLKGDPATQYYYHYVYVDNPGTGENYSTSFGRKYIGTYTDTIKSDANSFAVANAKPGIVWNLAKGDKGDQGITPNENLQSGNRVLGTATLPRNGWVGLGEEKYTYLEMYDKNGKEIRSNLSKDKVYTVSFDAKNSIQGNVDIRVIIYVHHDSSVYGYFKTVNNIGTEWNRYSVQIKPAVSGDSELEFRISFKDNRTDREVYIRKVKVEEGDTATAFSYSPEDTVGENAGLDAVKTIYYKWYDGNPLPNAPASFNLSGTNWSETKPSVSENYLILCCNLYRMTNSSQIASTPVVIYKDCYVDYDTGTIQMRLINTDKLLGVDAEFSGHLKAATGSFTGDVTLESTNSLKFKNGSSIKNIKVDGTTLMLEVS